MQSRTLLSRTDNGGGDRVAKIPDVQVRFGRRLREVREGKGVSQEKLAEDAGLHRTYVSAVERGLKNISLVNIERLAQALGVPMTDLLRFEGSDSAPS
jgi:transcriptional regulator with XRE-family HTH domain